MNQLMLRRRLLDAVADVHADDELWQRITARIDRRRRQRRQALALNLAVLLALAVAVIPVVLDRLATDRPAATTVTGPPPPPTVILGKVDAREPPDIHVQPAGPAYLIAEGTVHDGSRSSRWQYVAFRSTTGSVCHGFRHVPAPHQGPLHFGCEKRENLEAFDRAWAERHGPEVPDARLRGAGMWRGRSLFPSYVAGMIGTGAVEVRLHRRNGEQIVLGPVGGYPGVPVKFFATVISDPDGHGDTGMLLRQQITIVDSKGGTKTVDGFPAEG